MKSTGYQRLIVSQSILCAFLFFSFFFLSCSPAQANGLTISSVKIVGWDTTKNTARVQFNITWNNAWRDATNWDAAWVFIKFTTNAAGSPVVWSHATLANQGHKTTAGQEAEIVLPTEPSSGYKGVFIQFPATTGTHTFSATGVNLVWDYGKDGVSDAQIISATNTAVKVFGIEMVYIPEGAFAAGDGTATFNGCPIAYNVPSTAAFSVKQYDVNCDMVWVYTSPWYIASENSLDTGDGPDVNWNGGTGYYYYTSSGYGGEDASGSSFTIPLPFPKGYKAFYLMKYEISQGQYRDFYNTLTGIQQTNRSETVSMNIYPLTDNSNVTYRQAIRSPGSTAPVTMGCDYNENYTYNEAADGEWIACNFLSWVDLCAYADWAALRPMTELEFEKAARGPWVGSSNYRPDFPIDGGAVNGEYAWGTTNITQVTSINATYAAKISEVAGNSGNGLCAYGNHGSVQGPLRVGFAATGSTTREGAGAGYYGNMELSGNVREQTVTVGNATGRAFQGSQGDGILSSGGYATNADWPGYASGQVTGTTGAGLRGGSWPDDSWPAMLSDRSSASVAAGSRVSDTGGRCARTAP